MKNIKIITDSAADITDNSRDDLIVLPMTISYLEMGAKLMSNYIK